MALEETHQRTADEKADAVGVKTVLRESADVSECQDVDDDEQVPPSLHRGGESQVHIGASRPKGEDDQNNDGQEGENLEMCYFGEILQSTPHADQLSIAMLTEDPVAFDSEAYKAAQTFISQNLGSVFQLLQGVDLQSGLSFLNGKIIIYAQILRDLLLNNITMLRSQQLEDQPVRANLLFNKVLLTKLEPIEAKMSYELNKLIKLADNQDQAAAQSDNPLFLKPRPDLLVNDDVVKEGIYRAPKLQSELPPEIKKKRKEQNRESRQIQRVRMKYLREQMDQQDNINMMQVYKQSAAQRKKRQYEEENFIRLPQTKQERKLRLQKERGNKFASQGGMLNDITDFSELKKVRKAFGLQGSDEEQDRPAKVHKKIKKGKKLKSKRRKGDY